MPFLFIVPFVANIASLMLPVSNLTNLLIFDGLDLHFLEFARVMWIPHIVAVRVNLLILLWLFRNQIPKSFANYAIPEIQIADRWLIVTGAMLWLTLLVVTGLGVLDQPLWWGATAGALLMLAASAVCGRIAWPQMANDLSPSIFVFVLSLSIVVEAFRRAWLDDQVLSLPTNLASGLMTSIGISAVGSNIIYNIPMTLLTLGVVQQAPIAIRDALAYGSLEGANVGPALTTYGSLATMLWLTQLRRRGIDLSTAEYMSVSAVTGQTVLITTGVALWIVLRL